ncbi:bifunctional non-homologous end joining protein LigD [Gracilibacillus orientalis]|uniref:DNA ligase (ATP) n=1 Tax=Gracilibacillus orientalis TaxID=334253 RepID=A0A1I4KPK8_9BACI|nr:DNA ligase D [Gracilibacillus orientalis]SFL80712.1 bifunctional non-homologous end joining protein LigD [Gracilibacillus orientalis]
MWKPMLPTLVNEAPSENEWIYQVKYDGYRCGLHWTDQEVKLWSRNGHDLSATFPEIISWCKQHASSFQTHLPLLLDGELVITITDYRTDFEQIQMRSRLKTYINKYSQKRPATFVAFDILQSAAQNIRKKSFSERDQMLSSILDGVMGRIRKAPIFEKWQSIREVVDVHQAEGVVAKQKNAAYAEGKRSKTWLKIKNYRTIPGIVTNWNMENDYLTLQYYQDDALRILGKCKNGLERQEKETLNTFFKRYGQKVNGTTWKVEPSICMDINCLNAKDQEIREPVFNQFRFDIEPTDCNQHTVDQGLAQFPSSVRLSRLEKELFPAVTKLDYLCYLRWVAPFMLPGLKDRRLTLIRYPDGVHEHSFYQKHLPDYAPSFIRAIPGDDGEMDIRCQDLQSLIWFGNHGGLEFHVPFNKINKTDPEEIVFDLDPPSLDQFSIAVHAARLIKEMMEHQGFTPFVKTSGRTGLQIHILIHHMTYNETRTLMEATAKVLVESDPDHFTIERLKKNRGNRLYIDYVQHAPGKTIIAPYSTRATEEATVATPLFWNEVNETLDPRMFTIHTVPTRIKEKGCPFNLVI